MSYWRGLKLGLMRLGGLGVVGAGCEGVFTYMNTPERKRQEAIDGVSRSARFWWNVTPIYLHYLIVEKQVAGLDELAQESAYNQLHNKYAEKVERIALSLRGFYVKAAQVMSTRDELVPQQYMNWCKKMQDQVPTEMSADQVKSLVEESLNVKLESVFEEFDLNPIGAASIGQVHLARLKNDPQRQKVVVKVQYPGIENKFRADMNTIRTFCEFAMPQHVPFLAEIERQFLTEFNYIGEAENMQLIHDNLERDPHWKSKVVVPKPFMELCSREVLTMEYIEGKRMIDGVRESFGELAKLQGKTLKEFEDEQKEMIRKGTFRRQSVEEAKESMQHTIWLLHVRDFMSNVLTFCVNAIAFLVPVIKPREYSHVSDPLNLGDLLDVLLRVHGHQIFRDGAWNADCHPGNVLLCPDGRLGLLDYGQVKRLDVDPRLKYAKMIVALANDDKEEIVRVAVDELGVRTKHMDPDIIYRMMCFTHDRDSEDIMNGMNIHKFMQWMDEKDPVVSIPDDFVMAGRASILLRGVANAFQMTLRTAPYWKPYAEQLLQAHRKVEAK